MDVAAVCGTSVEEVSEDIKGKLTAKAQTFLRLGQAQLSGEAERAKTYVEVRSNRSDAARELHFLYHISCVLIYQDSNFSTDEKLKKIDELRKELKPSTADAPIKVLRALFTCAQENKDGCGDDFDACLTPSGAGNEFDPTSFAIEQMPLNDRDAHVYQKGEISKSRICYHVHSAGRNGPHLNVQRVNAKLTVIELVASGGDRPSVLFRESYRYPSQKPFADVSSATD
jgi:hypothetical protein